MSDTFDLPIRDDNSIAPNPAPAKQNQKAPDCAPKSKPSDRRIRRRAQISAPLRVRSLDVTQGGPDEITTTLDVSRGGLLFVCPTPAFSRGMVVAVTFPYTKSYGALQAEQEGRVARVTEMPDGRFSVAVILGASAGEDLVDSSGRKCGEKPITAPGLPERDTNKPLILVVDADCFLRDSLKVYLMGEGYDVIALGTVAEAHEVLKLFTPDLLIAEIEGESMPGYELCAYVKTTPRLQTIPVMLLTSSAYPSDYSSAHSLGAVVCMAKPYRQERLGHVVRLLAPTKQAKEQAAPVRPADPKRKLRSPNTSTSATLDSVRWRHRPSW